MFGRAAIRLGIGPHSSFMQFLQFFSIVHYVSKMTFWFSKVQWLQLTGEVGNSISC